jgi:hypothetical protein
MDETRQKSPAPGLSDGDPTPTGGDGRPPVLIIVAITVVLIAFVVLHLTGIFGPGSH